MASLSFDQTRSPLQTHSSLEKEDFVLYQPNPTKQILLYDRATSSSVLTFLKMKDIPTAIKNFTNAEFMSENGRLPVVVEHDNKETMCGFNEVYRYVMRKLNCEPTILELSYLDWIESRFLEAEMYLCWIHEPLREYTRSRYIYDLPWPVSSILYERKKGLMERNLSSKFKNFDDFLDQFNGFLTQLSKRIGSGPYCMGDSGPSSVDALIYGHTKTIIDTHLVPKFTDTINRQRRIVTLMNLVHETYPS